MVKKLSKKLSGSIINPSKTSLRDRLPLPKLIIFDLDYTLWPFWVDTHVSPPLKASPAHDAVKDRLGELYAFYPEVPSVLSFFREQNIKIAAASRTQAPEVGREMLRLLHVSDPTGKTRKALEYFDYLEIYPGSKTQHFARLQKQTGLPYEEMLFFDDEARNRNVETLGVHMYLVRDGVNRAEVDAGIREWRRKHGHDEGMDADSGYGG